MWQYVNQYVTLLIFQKHPAFESSNKFQTYKLHITYDRRTIFCSFHLLQYHAVMVMSKKTIKVDSFSTLTQQ